MKIESGKTYKTRSGAFVDLFGEPDESGACLGDVLRSGLYKVTVQKFMANGRLFSNRDSINDIIEECPAPFTTWMCQVGSQSPMPAPGEEIAREWAKKSAGRAFRVMEIIE